MIRFSKLYARCSVFKGLLSGLRQFMASENPLKIMKNAFYFTSKALSSKRLYKKDKVNFKFYDAKGWLKNNRNTHMAQYFEK